MKKLPAGIQNIDEILNDDFLYVDKTQFALQLINEGKHYFISRPRRFGKSLFISTLSAIFNGKKELFKKCFIYQSSYVWQKHPVLSVDFSQIPNRTPEAFETGLKELLQKLAKYHGFAIEGSSVQLLLSNLVEGLSQDHKVVVLVDEYDKPIINHLQNSEIADKNRDILKDFFATLKSLDKHLKFTFVTGVSKFSQVSLFSGPNNLDDITLDPKYSAMMGYTRAELLKHFKEHINHMSQTKNLSSEAILDELKQWYNGYCFSEECELVYNPYSTLFYFKKGKASSYWFSSGTPSFLIDEVRKYPQSIVPLSGSVALRSSLSDIAKTDHIDLAALMFQTGYLTIRKYHCDEDAYTLDFPNREVRGAFFNSLLKEFAKINPMDVAKNADQIRKNLSARDIQSFVEIINLHFSKIPYQLFNHANESFYHAVLLTLLEKSGFKTRAEVSTNIGRIDLVCESDQNIYVFELKLDKTSAQAMTQAADKHYQQRYLDEGKTILVIGIHFSSSTRNISDWDIKTFPHSNI